MKPLPSDNLVQLLHSLLWSFDLPLPLFPLLSFLPPLPLALSRIPPGVRIPRPLFYDPYFFIYSTYPTLHVFLNISGQFCISGLCSTNSSFFPPDLATLVGLILSAAFFALPRRQRTNYSTPNA
jgi:hypothetical protein